MYTFKNTSNIVQDIRYLSYDRYAQYKIPDV